MNFDFDIPNLVPAGFAFFPKFFQGANATFVADATGLDSFANPNLFQGQFLIEQCLLLFFGCECRFFPFQKGRVVTGPVEDATPV